MAEIMYNGIVLPYCKTTQYDQSAHYDSETDWVRQDFAIATETYFTADYLQLLFPDLVGKTDNAADIMNVVRSRLMQPRRQLSVKCAGVEVIPQRQVGNTGFVDAKNGPQPQYCNVIQMNDATFIVSWSIKASYWENNETRVDDDPKVRNQPGNNVLSCRWSESQDIDSCLYTTRTRSGRYTIRSDNAARFIVDKFRSQFAVTGVPRGFIRQSSSYKVDPSGLALEFTLIDQQVYKLPPRPAYEASGRYIEQTVNNGGMRYGEVQISLRGSAQSDPGKLVLAALGIASAKLRANGVNLEGAGPNNPGRIGVLRHCYLTQDLYDNKVDVNMKAMMNQARFFVADNDNRALGKYWGWDVTQVVATPGSDPRAPRDMNYIVRGTAGDPANRMMLQAAAYYDPSLTNTAIDRATGQFTGGLPEVGTLGNKVERD